VEVSGETDSSEGKISHSLFGHDVGVNGGFLHKKEWGYPPIGEKKLSLCT